jgi:hypothetical protein
MNSRPAQPPGRFGRAILSACVLLSVCPAIPGLANGSGTGTPYLSNLWVSHFMNDASRHQSGQAYALASTEDNVGGSKAARRSVAGLNLTDPGMMMLGDPLDDQQQDSEVDHSAQPLTDWQITQFSPTYNPLNEHVIASGAPTVTIYLVGIVALIVLGGGLLSSGKGQLGGT